MKPKPLRIPRAARPALKWIRALAPRPRTGVVMVLANDTEDGDALRPAFRARTDPNNSASLPDERCPLGLMSSAKSEAPYPKDCGIADRSQHPALRAFGHWWDNLSLADARRAVNLIWPRAWRAR